MCFEFEQEYWRQRAAEEARKEAERSKERDAPKPAPEKDVREGEPVPA